ncbi:MAG: HAMP domain-containing protein, partial [Burkholderiales bacterium]|nr:HAMP domain-containing protein [Burkholderiales bacterium]
MLSNLTIGKRLGWAFGLMILALLAIVYVGVSRVIQMHDLTVEITEINNEETRLVTAMTDLARRDSIYSRNVILVDDADAVAKQIENIRVARAAYEVAEKSLEKMFAEIASTTAREREMFDKIRDLRRRVIPLQEHVAELGSKNRSAEATAFLLKDAAPAMNEWITALTDLGAFENALNKEAASRAEQAFKSALYLMLGSALVLVLVGCAAAVVVTRSIVRPLETAMGVARQLSVGDLTVKIGAASNDETGRMLVAMEELARKLATINTEINRVSKEHDAGDIDVVIDVAKFDGEYRVMAQGVNDMVAGHIAVKKKAMACVAEFGRGNFAAPLEKFPGKKAFINDIVEKVRANLQGVVTEVNRVSDQHDAGDIDAVIDVARFDGDFRTMTQGINDMVAGHIAVKKKAMACVAEFGRGNFEAPLERFPGKKAFINDTIEQVRGNLKALIVDVDALVGAANAGRLEVRADASRHHGDFRKIVDGINRTLDAVIEPLNQAKLVLKAMENGNLSQRASVDYEGQLRDLCESINNTADKLSHIIGEVRSS